MRYKKKRKQSFTLLEILVALCIISALSVIVSIQGKNLLSYHRFRSSLQTFLFDINRYQILSMTQNTDITCQIIKEKDCYKVTWSPEGPLPVSTKHLSYDLPHTEKLLLGGKEMSKIEFTIFSSGRIFPTEKISFISPSQEKKVFIDLIYPKYLQNT